MGYITNLLCFFRFVLRVWPVSWSPCTATCFWSLSNSPQTEKQGKKQTKFSETYQIKTCESCESFGPVLGVYSLRSKSLYNHLLPSYVPIYGGNKIPGLYPLKRPPWPPPSDLLHKVTFEPWGAKSSWEDLGMRRRGDGASISTGNENGMASLRRTDDFLDCYVDSSWFSI